MKTRVSAMTQSAMDSKEDYSLVKWMSECLIRFPRWRGKRIKDVNDLDHSKLVSVYRSYWQVKGL